MGQRPEAARNTRQIVGLIADTHGLVRPEALRALFGVDLILHAGDIGGPHVLPELETIAPVVAISGNIDGGECGKLPPRLLIQVGDTKILMLHDLQQLEGDPPKAGARVVVSGHSHKPSVEERKGVLYVNPGSAGPRRFRLPVSVGRLTIEGNAVSAQIVELATENSRRTEHVSTAIEVRRRSRHRCGGCDRRATGGRAKR